MSSKSSKVVKKHKPSYGLATIKVVGIGGGGGNAVSRMRDAFSRNIEFVAINTDHQDLDQCNVRHKIYIGRSLTHGLGTGMNPELGRQAAEENRSEIAEILKGADLIFLTAGFGGGTGTGAMPVVAEVAKQTGALTLAFVTKPFAFEGNQRERIAQEGLSRLRDKVDALVVVPNDRIFTVINKDTPIVKAFQAIDDVLKHALEGIVDLIVNPGMVNVDFADVRTIIHEAGSAIVGLGIASGQDRAVKAVTQALHSPLLEVNPEGAKGVLLGISGRDLKMEEVNDAAKIVAKAADPGARIIFGAYHDRRLKDNQLKVTVIATGFSESNQGNTLFGAQLASSKPLFGETKKQPATDWQEENLQKIDKEFERSSLGKPPAKPASLEDLPKTEPKKKESDVWDIPTFLRKKKR